MKQKLIFLALCFISTTLICFSQPADKPYLVVLSMDGFRWDYPDSFPTPNLKQISTEGVRAKSMVPSFPYLHFSESLYIGHRALSRSSRPCA